MLVYRPWIYFPSPIACLDGLTPYQELLADCFQSIVPTGFRMGSARLGKTVVEWPTERANPYFSQLKGVAVPCSSLDHLSARHDAEAPVPNAWCILRICNGFGDNVRLAHVLSAK